MTRKRKDLSTPPLLLATVLLSSCGGGADPAYAPDAAPLDAPPADGVWGWISVIEENDTCNQWGFKTTWYGGVRAFFGRDQSYSRALPHHTDFLTEIARDGDCAVFDSGLLSEEAASACRQGDPGTVFGEVDYDCSPPPPYPEDCTTPNWCCQDAECRRAPNEVAMGHCVSLAPHWGLGQITIDGTLTNLTLVPDAYDRYAPTSEVPVDLFSGGETITARTEGGALDAIELSAPGVKHLELGNSSLVDLTAAVPRVTWTPSGEDVRVQVAIYSGAHDPNPVLALMLCDAPDAAGEVAISPTLVATFSDRTCGGASFWGEKCSRVTRYTKSVTATPGDGEIELFVGSARHLLVSWPRSL